MVGSTPNPDAAFMAQAARCLTDAVEGFLAGHRVLICDRDGKWTEGFRGIVVGSGVCIVLTPFHTSVKEHAEVPTSRRNPRSLRNRSGRASERNEG